MNAYFGGAISDIAREGLEVHSSPPVFLKKGYQDL
jgi:hypothetical protein